MAERAHPPFLNYQAETSGAGGWAQPGCPGGEGGSLRAALRPGRAGLRAAQALRPRRGGRACGVRCCPPAPSPAAVAAGAGGRRAAVRPPAPARPTARPRSYPLPALRTCLRAGAPARLLRGWSPADSGVWQCRAGDVALSVTAPEPWCCRRVRGRTGVFCGKCDCI